MSLLQLLPPEFFIPSSAPSSSILVPCSEYIPEIGQMYLSLLLLNACQNLGHRARSSSGESLLRPSSLQCVELTFKLFFEDFSLQSNNLG